MPKVSSYTEEFKRSSVELALNSDQSLSQTAKDLGVNRKTFTNWVKIYRDKSQKPEKTQAKPSLEEEVKRLRKENNRLKEEREILKKATAFFVKEQV